ncbi:MAG TPA: AAA family ATPase [Candidatus Nanoarchaeia archaeon]|nr:AAA family ATPase [Candidatus Nanoarchaeia archaeon]
MSYFVIIRGPGGVGKSTIGKLLAKRIQAKIIHFDKIMDELGLDYIPGERWIPLNKFLKADEVMIPKFRKILRKNNLVLDGNFYHKKQVEDLIKSLNFPCFVVTLKASLQECIKRDKTRKDKLGEQATADVFKLVSAFDFGVMINTQNKTPEETVKEIFSYLPKNDPS